MTRSARRSAVVATVLGATLLAGCISSEGTGGKSKEGPERSIGPIDTAKVVASAHSSAAGKSARTQTKRPSRSTKFTARQDTVKAAIVRRNKSPLRLPKIQRPANPVFTVQIGAFALPKNALRNQKLAKARFTKLPVYNNFYSRGRIYRVSVGKFATLREALAAKKDIVRKYPKDYSGCWINYIAR